MEMNDFMKEVVYGYNDKERKFTRQFELPKYVSENSQERIDTDELHQRHMSPVRRITDDYEDLER